jgi:hypothetical protein
MQLDLELCSASIGTLPVHTSGQLSLPTPSLVDASGGFDYAYADDYGYDCSYWCDSDSYFGDYANYDTTPTMTTLVIYSMATLASIAAF